MSNRGKKLLLSLLIAGASNAQQGTLPVRLDEVVRGEFQQQSSIGEMRSMSDGLHYTAMNEAKTMVVKYAYRTGEPVDTLFDLSKARECTFDTFQGYALSSTGHRMLIWREVESIYRRSFQAKVYDYDVRRNMIKPLNESGEKVMIPTFSPDGRMCAFVEAHNIRIKKFDYDTEVQVTHDGAFNRIINGATDWVYEEEFSVTNTMTWSPDNEYLAYIRFDESRVPEYDMQLYGEGYYTESYRYKYPNAGDENSTVSLHAYSVTTKEIKQLEVPIAAEDYIPRITFAHDASKLAVMTLNRHQNLFRLFYLNPKSGVARMVLKEENDCYIDDGWLHGLRFTSNGFLYVSEKDGYAHIYQYDLHGALQRQVTQGTWDVTRLLGMDEKSGAIYYESAEESPLRRALYMVDPKGVKRKLSQQEGTNRATFNADYSYYVNHYSNASTPLTITLHETRTQKVVRTLLDNASLKQRLTTYRFSPKEFIRLSTASGVELNGWIVKPANFSEEKKYPVLMVQYSGPNSQQATDSYKFEWEHFLASKGVIVVCVDGRGTAARGEAFRKCTYLRLGELESKDQVEAAHALAELPYVDGARMAIWGWSFGGYNTLMAMSVGNGTFKAGIAVAPPTDWRYYDTVYTERFMRTPKENKAGYDATSPIKLADKMQGELLLIHGSADDNVHVKQTLDYAEALVQAGKQFEMHIYKDRDHSITGANTRLHLYTKMSNFLLNQL